MPDLVTEQIPNANKVEITDPIDQDVPFKMGQDPDSGNNIIIQHIKHITDDNTVERKPFTPVKDSSASVPSKQTVAREVYKTKTHDLTLVSENDSQNSVTSKVYDSFPIRNKQGLYTASFSRKVEKNLLKFSYGDAALLLAPLEPVSVTGKVYKNTINYENIYPNIDLRYILEENRLKEEIVVQKYTGQSNFSFQLSVTGAVYATSLDDRIYFIEPDTGRISFYIPRPYALDNNGVRCDANNFELTKEGILKFSIDPNWLKKAAYPVIIDPTINLAGSDGAGIESYWSYSGTDLGGGWEASVNTCNLNLVLSKALMFIPGRGLSIGDSITYNSLDTRGGPIGIGWHLGTDISVTERQDGTVLYIEGDGSSHVFTPNGSGGYTAPPGIYLTLQKLAPGNFKITDIKQNVYTFVNGKPSQFTDRDNNTTTFTYNANGRLYQVSDPSGRKLTYAYNTAGQVSAITDPANRTYQLTYQNSRLVNITDPVNKTVTFSYDANGYLGTFTDPLSRFTSFINSYDGKLQTIRDARTNGQDIYNTVFSQTTQPNTMITTMTDPGSRRFTFTHDSNTGNLTKYQDQLGNSWLYSWTNNNLITIRDAKGATTYEYDTQGNVTKKTTTVDSNSSNNIVQTMTYDDYNQLLELVDGSGRKTSYKYDNRGNLLSTSNPDIKESNGRKYDQYGNVVEYSPGLSSKYNLLMNGSFENSTNNWTRVPGSATVGMEGCQLYGNSALKMSSSTYTTDYYYQRVSNLNSYDKLTLRADIKLDNVQAISGSGGGVIIKLYYDSNNYEYIVCTGNGTSPLVLTSTVPYKSTSRYVDVYIGLYNASGTAWIDGVQLENMYQSGDGHTLSAFNPVENSSFENDAQNWIDGTGFSLNTGVAWEGVRSGKLYHSYNRITSFYQDVPVYGGESMTLSGMLSASCNLNQGALK